MAETDISSLLGSLSPDDIEGLKKTAQSLMATLGSNGKPDFNTPETQSPAQNSNALSAFSKTGFPDLSVLSRLAPLLSELGKKDERADFIAALKPLLSEPRQHKADEAVKIIKLMSLVPLLKEQGIL